MGEEMEEGFASIFAGVILLIIGSVLLFSQAVPIHTLSDTSLNSTGGTSGVTGALVNVSANAKSLYGLTDFVWAGSSLVFLVIGGFAIAMGVKKLIDY